jgi:hypothetical protein
MPAALTLLRSDTHRLAHEDVRYEPISTPSALGALLFALDLLAPDAVAVDRTRYADRLAIEPALAAARQFGLILQRHARRADRAAPRLPASVRVDDLRAWAHAAAATAPEAEIERFCWRFARRLGADPWCDGRPAIELRNQQFALFEDGFDEPAGAPPPASDAPPDAAVG